MEIDRWGRKKETERRRNNNKKRWWIANRQTIPSSILKSYQCCWFTMLLTFQFSPLWVNVISRSRLAQRICYDRHRCWETKNHANSSKHTKTTSHIPNQFSASRKCFLRELFRMQTVIDNNKIVDTDLDDERILRFFVSKFTQTIANFSVYFMISCWWLFFLYSHFSKCEIRSRTSSRIWASHCVW